MSGACSVAGERAKHRLRIFCATVTCLHQSQPITRHELASFCAWLRCIRREWLGYSLLLPLQGGHRPASRRRYAARISGYALARRKNALMSFAMLWIVIDIGFRKT
jgi:hypothetical protein